MNAVVDIGSNSVRLLVFSDKSDFEEGVTATEITRLGYQLDQTGRLSETGVAATWKAFERFAEIIQQRGVKWVEAYATEAVRKASDGADFVAEIKRRFGWQVRIISGEEEAMIGFLGATAALPNGDWTLIDIGGASTEIIQGRDQLDARMSFPIGALRYTDKPEIDLAQIFQELPALRGQLIGIGGTITTVKAMDLALTQYQRHRIQGQVLTREQIQVWIERWPQLTPAERIQLPGLDPKREPIILAGMKILLFLLDQFQQPSLLVSDYGNLEGYALSRGLCNTKTLD